MKLTKEDIESMQQAEKEIADLFEKENQENHLVFEEIKKQVSKEYLKIIEEELEETNGGTHLEIVDKPLGDKEECQNGYYIWIDQYVNGGYSGDEYDGNCYMKLPNGKYFKWNYSL